METIINKRIFANFEGKKGHGQVINRGTNLGWEMNYTLNDGESDVKFYSSKTEAKKALSDTIS